MTLRVRRRPRSANRVDSIPPPRPWPISLPSTDSESELESIDCSLSPQTTITYPDCPPVRLSHLTLLVCSQLAVLNLPPGSRIAIWRAPAHIALAFPFAAARTAVVPVWLNDRWALEEVVSALRDACVHAVCVGTIAEAEILGEALRGAVGSGPISSTVVVAMACSRRGHSRSGGEAPSRLDVSNWSVVNGSMQTLSLGNLNREWPVRPGSGVGHLPAGTQRKLELPCGVFYTSGTTGQPKGVVLSHGAMLCQARAKLSHVGYDSGTRYLQLAPLFHLGGASSALAVAISGSTILLPRTDENTPAGWLNVIESEKVNTLVIVPSVLQMMVDAHDILSQSSAYTPEHAQGRTVKTILYGGGACSRSLRSDVTARVFPSCKALIGAYGMTEAASSMTFIDHCGERTKSRRHGSVGRTPEHVELEIRLVKESFRTKAGGWLVGEIFTRGPHVMDGYFGRLDETRAVLSEDGWLSTGDLGYADGDGYLYVVGRNKDMIKTGGENVFAGEVEAVLGRHPSVTSSAVVGVPHRVLGEAVVAAVITSNGKSSAEPSLESWCRQRLSPYKRPKWFVSMDRFPSNPTGKVLKPVLRHEMERFLQQKESARSKL